jgi:hypothetical protein
MSGIAKPHRHNQNTAALEMRRKHAYARAAAVAPVIVELQAAGVTSAHGLRERSISAASAKFRILKIHRTETGAEIRGGLPPSVKLDSGALLIEFNSKRRHNFRS